PTEVQSLLYFSSIYAVSSALSFTLSLHDALPIFLSFAVLFLIILPQFLGGNYSSLNSETQELFIALFHSGWFVVSLWTQTLVLYTLRTKKLPFIESRPSTVMTFFTLLGIVIGTIVPYTQLGTALDLTALPGTFWLLLLGIVIAYLILVTIVKYYYVKRYGELL